VAASPPSEALMEDNDRGRGFRDILVWALLLALPLAWLVFVLPQSLSNAGSVVPISQVAAAVERGTVRQIFVQGDTVTVTYNDGSSATSRKEPNQSIEDALRSYGVTSSQLASVEIQVAQPSPLPSLGISLWVVVGLVVLGVVMLVTRQSPTQSGPDQTLSFLKSRARKIVADRPKVRFDDAAGVDEAKQELREVVEFLRSPSRFTALGARIPKGVLLIGPPGTGKTLLARAMAGEAGVPFFSISGSEFVELFVGVGASRVRDLFDQAKRHAPCIVFVDEIDAVGRQRGFGIGGGHDEREQTLNQILVEMDGFDKQTNIVVVAATNRPDVLDPALLRPGRFDRRVSIDAPDVTGRRAILRIHAKGKPLAADVDLDRIAMETPGFCGADLENLLNESAILAARAAHRVIGDVDLEEAVDRVLAGPERRTRLITVQEKAITAYHEAGHAVTAHALASVDPVHKVTVIPRGVSGGHTRLIAEGDRQLWTESQMMDRLAFALGGMAAEQLVFGETTSGVSNDLEQATDIALKMVCEFGMSNRIGPVVVRRHEGYGAHTRDVADHPVSDLTSAEIDREVRRLVDSALSTARTVLERRRRIVDSIAQTLMREETLQGERLRRLLEGNDEEPARLDADAPTIRPPTIERPTNAHRPEAAA
jgi:cell division protease FtsH